MQKAIGHLILEARLEKGMPQLRLAKIAGMDVKTLRTMEDGTRWATDVNRAKIESALGWRPGSMQDMWNDREHVPIESVTMSEMLRNAHESTWSDLAAEEAETVPVRRASQLTDEELLAEISYRFRTYKNQLYSD
ncbi:helix-turn-helix domain-containing protein [Pseudarthrobacter sp. P1]|uniref:helix-turn-helix domain-containing protein n=1 Tax=Pseudarthrobacter sp. P1 TaxID=3418418 RepID=UPI003CF0A6B8